MNLLDSCPNSPFFNFSTNDKIAYCKHIAASISNSTWKSYTSALQKYKKLGNKIWPWNQLLQIKFSNFLLKKNKISNSSLISYFSAISFFNSFLGFIDKPISKAVRLYLRGWENSNLKKPKQICNPISFKLLKKIRSKIKNSFHSKTKFLVMWSLCCLGFFGSLRISEFVPRSEFFSDKTSDLLWSDISFKKDYMDVKIKHPKTKPADPIIITFFPFPIKKFCPITAIKNLKKHILKKKKWPMNEAIARVKKNKFISNRKFTKIIKFLLRKEKGNFSARSFRAGIPSELERFPELFNDLHSKNWGRWKSNSYKLYMKQDLTQKKWIFEQLIKILK